MFDSVGWGEVLVLVVAGLFILGPERLPAAAAWLGRTVRQVRDYATGARDQLRSDLGPEFDELRKPLDDLRELRALSPRQAMRRALLEPRDDPSDLPFDAAPPDKPNGYPLDRPADPPAPLRLAPGERPPIDPDAT